MLKRTIKKIRQQPRVVRDKIALGIAISFTAMVFSIWAYHVPDRVSAIAESDKEKKDDSPMFSSFFSEVKDQVSSVKSAVTEDVIIPESNASSSLEDLLERINAASSTGEVEDEPRFSFSAEETSSSSVEQEEKPVRIITTQSAAPTSSVEGE